MIPSFCYHDYGHCRPYIKIVGAIVSALVFAWKHATHINAKQHTDKDDEGSRLGGAVILWFK